MMAIGVTMAAAAEDGAGDRKFDEGLSQFEAGRVSEAMSSFREACLMGPDAGSQMFSCNAWLDYLQDGTTGLRVEPASAKTQPDIPAYEKAADEACKQGKYASACFRRAEEIDQATGAPSEEYIAAGCDAGSATTCSVLARYRYTGSFGERDLPGAFEAHGKACELGEQDNCLTAARMLALGAGVTKDLDMAVSAAQMACPNDKPTDPQLCIDAADFILEYGDDSPRDVRNMVMMLQRSCMFPTAEGCAWYAEELEFMAEDDPAASQELLDMAAEARRKACTYGDADSC
ncbi:MAG: hypothetical protein CMK07_16510 [Ponticaulis sp.]|nr:hypothetical protein [Ponticaulis sp.]